MITEDYFSYELSKLLKEKGFDEVCTRVYIEIEGRWGNYPYLHGATKEDAEHYFPELKETEDERIKKTIIRILKGEIGYTSKEDIDKYVTWLEKQTNKD